MNNFSLESNNMDFSSQGTYNSNFKPKFYVIFFIVFSMYYFFSPILSHFIFNFLDNYVNFSQLNLLNEILYKFLVPNLSLFLFLIIYIFIIEERKISFLFLGINKDFVKNFLNGLLKALSLILILVFLFILKDDVLFFKINKNFGFMNLLQLFFIFLSLYIKYFFIECFYRGWLINIFTHRYSIYLSMIFSSLIYSIVSFIEYKRIGLYLIYIFIFNILLSLMFLLYKNISIVISFHAFYDLLKKYILSLEVGDIKLNTIFYTSLDNNNIIYNIENNIYSLATILIITLIVLFIYGYINKRKN